MSEIRVNRVVAADGSSAPQFPSGLSLATGMGITNSPNILGAAVTFSGISQVTNTTDSTSSTTGSLIVTGGVGIAKNVYIGAGLSVAGTLTYEDVTNVDSVGLITAKSGVNITGGQLQVGVAYSVGAAGVATAAGFVGPLTGAVTGTTGSFSSNLTVGSGITMGSAGVATFSRGVTFKDADVTFDGDNQTITFVHDANCIRWSDSAQGQWGDGQDLRVYHDGSHSYINNTTGDLKLRYGGNDRVVINNDGTVTTGIGTFTAGANFDGILSEKFNTIAGKLSDNTNIDLQDGMIHYFSTQETTTCTPNIRYSGSKTLNNMMNTGDSLTVTVITTAAAGGYSANWTVDGSAVTEEWNGGSAPAAGGSGGYDCYTITLLKTGSAAFVVLGNLSNFA